MRAEPGWRVVLKKPVVRPPELQDIPGELLYKLVVMPIRFWGFAIPNFDERMLCKPNNVNVPVMPETAAELARYIESPVLRMNYIQSHTALADESGRPVKVVLPVPLGKARQVYSNVVDVLRPDETDKAAVVRIESIYEHDRNVLRLAQVKFVMES